MATRAEIIMRHGVSDADNFGYNEFDELAIPMVDATRAEIVFPINENTGLPTGDLARALDLRLTEQERASIISQLKARNGDYASSDLSDDELFQLVPSRLVVNDDVDRRLWSRYVHQTLLPSLFDEEAAPPSDK